MKKKFAGLLILVLCFIPLTGCNLPLPTCATDALQAVELVGPAQMSVVDSLTPTLQWSYPSAECAPEGYAITLWEGPVLVTDLGGGTGNPSTSWGPGAPLLPGKQYRWRVAPINGTTLGPGAGTFIFFTGPVCTDAALAAPTLLEPADGAVFNPSTDLLWWEGTGGCTPGGYTVDVSTDPAFGTNIGDSFDIPLTRMLPEGLVECQTYYWRVAAINGASVGPFSPTRSFVSDSTGACEAGPGGTPPASASIGGIVWHDLCATPDGPAPAPLPTGCVDAGGGSIRANGIREAGEPGIPGVEVDLHYGGCATEPVASVLTDSDGHYVFDGLLVFGSYCVAVRPLNPPNDGILIPGEWTYPPLGIPSGDAFANAMVDTGTILTDKDFGWDYQFLPVAAAAASEATPTLVASSLPPKFMFDKNAFCRKGPGVNYSDVTAIPDGDTVDVLGASPDSLWYFILWKKFNAECWVAANTGHLIDDLQALPIFTPGPTPVPTVPSAPQYNSCSDYTTQELCKQDPKNFVCYWSQNNVCVQGKP